MAKKGQRQQQRRPRRTTRRRAAGPTSRWKVNPYINMVADPCNATLVPGLYGASEGLLARLKNTTQVPAGSRPQTCGYVLWCPDYHNKNNGIVDQPYAPNSGPDQGNMFMFISDDPTLSPPNTAANPYGAFSPLSVGQVDVGHVLDDPAANLLRSDIVADARVISACMQMTYYGKLQDSAGEVGFISNLPVSEIMEGGTGGIPASVNNLMAYCANKHRLGIDTLENVYRPNELSSNHFRTNVDTLLDVADQTAGPSVVSQSATTLSPRVFGFVWRNVEPSAGLTFDFVKSIEWRAVASSGLTQTPIQTTGASLVPHVNAAIDRHTKRDGHSLWERIKGGMSTATSEISKIAFSGSSNGLMAKALEWLGKEGMRIGLQSLPSIAMDSAPLLLL